VGDIGGHQVWSGRGGSNCHGTGLGKKRRSGAEGKNEGEKSECYSRARKGAEQLKGSTAGGRKCAIEQGKIEGTYQRESRRLGARTKRTVGLR